ARLFVEQWNAEHPEEMQPEEQDHRTGDNGQLVPVGLDELADDGRAGPQPDEDSREAEDEDDRSYDDPPPQAVVQPVLGGRGHIDGRATQKAEIRRHERQNARAQKAHKPGQCYTQVDVQIDEHVSASPCTPGSWSLPWLPTFVT